LSGDEPGVAIALGTKKALSSASLAQNLPDNEEQ
jgi:hypothetical protein